MSNNALHIQDYKSLLFLVQGFQPKGSAVEVTTKKNHEIFLQTADFSVAWTSNFFFLTLSR